MEFEAFLGDAGPARASSWRSSLRNVEITSEVMARNDSTKLSETYSPSLSRWLHRLSFAKKFEANWKCCYSYFSIHHLPSLLSFWYFKIGWMLSTLMLNRIGCQPAARQEDIAELRLLVNVVPTTLMISLLRVTIKLFNQMLEDMGCNQQFRVQADAIYHPAIDALSP